LLAIVWGFVAVWRWSAELEEAELEEAARGVAVRVVAREVESDRVGCVWSLPA